MVKKNKGVVSRKCQDCGDEKEATIARKAGRSDVGVLERGKTGQGMTAGTEGGNFSSIYQM